MGLYITTEAVKELHVPVSLEKAEDYSYRVDSDRDWYTFLEACHKAGGNQTLSVHTNTITEINASVIEQAGQKAATEQFDQGDILDEWRQYIKDINRTQDFSKLNRAEFNDLVRNLEQLLTFAEHDQTIARHILLAPEGADQTSVKLHLKKMKDLVRPLGQDGKRAVALFNKASIELGI
jgi:hypothetical protein